MALIRSRVRRLAPDGPAQVEHTHRGQEWVPHWHAEWSFGAAVQGGCHCSIGGQPVQIRRGDLVVIAPHVVHTGAVHDSDTLGPVHMVMLYASPEWLNLQGVQPPAQGGVLHAPDLAADAQALGSAADVVPWLRAVVERFDSSGSTARAPTLSDNLIAPTQQQLLAQLQSAVLDGTRTVAALAARCGVSRKWMHLQMTRWTGMAPSDYLRTARLHRARLLLDEGMPPAEVAAACHFADQAHFTRWFRRAFGYTPGDWVAASQALQRD